MDTRDQRREDIARVRSNPPDVHHGAPGGVWGTSAECYEFLADVVGPDAVTLETGLGISTVLFGLWSREHICVVGSGEQVEDLRLYAAATNTDRGNVRFEVGTSDNVLPRLVTEPVDVYLIDGGHGYPHPIIDWYYGSLHLHDGGIVVIDDTQLPAVSDYLVRFIKADERWQEVGGGAKWSAYRKLGDFSVSEEWMMQPFLGAPRIPLMSRAKMSVHRQLTRLRR